VSSKRYPEEFKIEAVNQVVERGHNVAEVASRLGMTSHSLYAWQVLACTHVGGKCCAPLLKARV